MRNFKQWFQRLLLVLILTFAGWFCWTYRDTLAKVFELSAFDLVAILASYVAVYLLNAAMACLLLKNRGYRTPLWQMLVINCWSSLLGYVTVMRAGYYSGKAWYYRELHQIPITISLGTMAFLSLAMIFVNSVTGILAGAWALVMEQMAIPVLYWLVLGASLLLCAGAILIIFTLGRSARLPERARVWAANLLSIFTGTSLREVLAISGLLALTIPLQALALTLLFQGFGPEVPQLYMVFIAIFASLSVVISLTPSNIGVRELVTLLLVTHLGVSSVDIIGIMVVDRILQFLLTLAIGLGGYRQLGHRTQNSP